MKLHFSSWSSLITLVIISFYHATSLPQNTTVVSTLQQTYVDAVFANVNNSMSNSYFGSAVWWQNAAFIMSLADYEATFHTGQLQPLITNMLNDNNLNVNYEIDAWYDDSAWWALGALKGYNLYGNDAWKNAALKIYDDMSTVITTDICGGGVTWWTEQPNQKNTITNTLYMSLALKLYQITNDHQYIDSAKNILTWWTKWALTSDGGVHDSMTAPTCSPQYLDVWTYNSGPILAVLVDFYNITSNSSYLDLADKIANHAMTKFSNKGIMIESCDTQGCKQDEQFFKGVLAYYLGYYYVQSPRNVSIADYLLFNANSNLQNNMDVSTKYIFGPVWSGPYLDKIANIKTSICTIMVLGAGLQSSLTKSHILLSVNSSSTTGPSNNATITNSTSISSGNSLMKIDSFGLLFVLFVSIMSLI